MRYPFKYGREDKIRTCDPLNPIQVRYRTAPLPEPNPFFQRDDKDNQKIIFLIALVQVC